MDREDLRAKVAWMRDAGYDRASVSLDDLEELLGGSDQPRRRQVATEKYLKQLADVYRRAVADGRPPLRAVEAELGLTYSTAARHVMNARAAGLLPPTTMGRVTA